MTNNLRKAKKDLCSFAKKCKDFKYTDSALITFLITGAIAINIASNLFSAETSKSIENQKQVITTSIKDIHNQFTEVRKENDKLLKKSNMELIKLMEQGDHVVKSPWSSWQYGVNNFYNDWHGTYKGYGGKTGNTKYIRNPNDKFGTYSGGKYGVTTLKRNVIEPVSTIPVNAAVRPKDIHKTPLNLNLPIIEPPQKPNLNISVSEPAKIDEIKVNVPEITVTPPVVSTDVFTDYTFDRAREGKPAGADILEGQLPKEFDGSNNVFYAGYKPNYNGINFLGTGNSTNASGIYNTTSKQYTDFQIHFGGITPNIIYAHGDGYTLGRQFKLSNFDIHVAGGYHNGRGNVTGQIGIHTIANGEIKNVNGYLYGKAAFISLETWWAGKTTLTNVKLDVKGDKNTVFFIFPTIYQEITRNDRGAYYQRGGFVGDFSADIASKKNIIYSILGASGSYGIDSNGTYRLEGAGNLVYAGLGYSADFSKFAGTGMIRGGSATNWKPFIKLTQPVESYGDSNVILFFNNTLSSSASQKPWLSNLPQAQASIEKDNWNKTTIGIYQGEIEARANIGDQAQIDATKTTQTTDGNTEGNAHYVEKNVGVYAKSGQRDGIKPSEDLGADTSKTNGAKFDNDLIHNLQINNAEITFGKYSKDGIMLASENGTVMDVLMPTNPTIVTKMGSSVKDYSGTTAPTSSYDDNNNKAATGTIIAYSKGTWDKKNYYKDNKNNNQMQSADALLLQGKGSEINIGKDVELSARYKEVTDDNGNKSKSYPIAFAATDNGKVNAYGNTKAHGYGSIIGYASRGGEVTNYGSVTAKDDAASTDDDTKKYHYTNIGGYATGLGSKVTLGSNSKTSAITVSTYDGDENSKSKATITPTPTISTIYGIGALADDNGEVVLRGTTNINTGTSGGLLALNGGKVEYEGGTITHKNNVTLGTSVNDHDNTTPFYAKGDSSNGSIVFTGPTTLDMYDGVLITGQETDYNSSTTGTEIYRGLGNVSVNLQSDNVTIGAFSGLNNLTWDSQTDASHTYINGLPGISKFNGGTITTNNHSYKSILTDGKLNVTSTKIELDSAADQYNKIQMANEVVTIGSTTNVTGNVSSATIKGQGLSMGSLKTATSNATTGFNNEGTISVTGGTATSGIAGMNVSYGTINNGTSAGSSASVTIDNGAGLYGTNGSKLVNNGKITVASGAGIAGIGTGRTKQEYGTDVKTSASLGGTKTVEIENHGTINAAGTGSIGIYAENNTNAPKANVTVSSDKQLTVGTDGVGIAVVSATPTPMLVNHGTSDEGGTITVTAAGTGPDIKTGVNGKGIYAQNSDITLTGNYIIETPEKGIGIFASKNTNVTGTLEYKYNGSTTGTGMGIIYDQLGAASHTNNANVKLTNTTNTTGGMIGVYTTAGTGNTLTNNGDITGSSTALEFGIVSDGADIINKGNITLGNAALQENANVGIYAKTKNTITNDGKITVGDNAIGIYGYNINNNTGSIKAGDNGVAIYTQGDGTVNLNANSKIAVGKDQAVGVYAVGANQHINANAGSSMTIGDNSFGIVNLGAGNTIASNTANPVTLGTDAVYIYQNDNKGTVINHTPLTSTGDRNYGLYGNGNIYNDGAIDFSNGIGNVGMYATTGGTATNLAGGIIKVGDSDTNRKEYGVGMATGYYDDNPLSPTYRQVSNQGTIINQGTIEVSKPDTIGMYAVGSGSKAINYGNINLMGSKTVGMYIDRGAVGENWGTIQTTASGLTSAKGVYVANGGYIKNYGVINIAASDSQSAGIWTDNADHAEENANGINPVTLTSQTGTSTPRMKVATASDMKEMGGIVVKVPPKAAVPTVADAQGNIIPIYKLDTDAAVPQPAEVIIKSPSGVTPINLSASDYYMNFPSSSEISSIGMYVDTSGVNYTNPIQGLNYLTGLTDINLLFGAEATRYTTAKAIEVGDNILKPYNDALKGVVTGGTMLNIISSSLTWMAQPTKNPVTELLDKLYLIKVPYTVYAEKDDKNTYNFLDGLEQRYGVEGLGTREKLLFDKISSLNGGEGHILAQAFDEMKGHQYANIQQRTNATGNALDNEFSYLRNEWRNPTKQNNKIKAFGLRDEYNTDTPGIIDYKSNSYGVAYVHEDEKIKMGNSIGWYAGAVTNRFRFKDLGHSTEDQTMIKAGIFKTMSPKKDYNGALQWTVAGDVFAGINNMKRKFWIVDDTFEAKSTYHTYGAALKNELGYDIRMSERTHLRPYGALKMEYGRFSNIKENDGEVRLEVKGNDYFSVKPEAGLEFKYIQPLAVRTNLTVGVTAAYENELGKLQNRNQARVRYTTADWYNLEKEKEDKRGNGKFDLNIGVDNTRFGVTVNAGYDTKGNNIRGGIGFRAIY